MKHLIILTITLFALTAKGQDSNQTKKILIGFNLSPDYSFRTLKNSNDGSSSDLVINNRNDFEVAKLGFTTGLNIFINFSQLIGFETGIQYSNKGYKTKSQDLVYIPPSPNSPTKASFIYAYQYLGIPLKAKFSFGKGKVRYQSSIGLMTNFLLNVKQSANYVYSNGTTEKKFQSLESDFNKVDISPMLTFGIDYNLNNKMHLFVEPTYRYGVIPTNDTPVTEYLWSAGLNAGFYYAIK